MKFEDKIRLFGHFLLCKVRSGDTIIVMQSIDGDNGCAISPDNITQLPLEGCKLILKDIHSITRTDALHCCELANLPMALCKFYELRTNSFGQMVFCFPDNSSNYRDTLIFDESKLSFTQVDYLRSKGYAIGVPKEFYEIEL